MKERPILFSAPMVRAILDGKKTQTRRVVKLYDGNHANKAGCFRRALPGERGEWVQYCAAGAWTEVRCPYGAPGDRLWVRETWRPFYTDGAIYLADAGTHRLNAASEAEAKRMWPGWKPSIHMPRRHSRLELEVTGVRVERLKDITEKDAAAEGADEVGVETGAIDASGNPREVGSYAAGFAELWASINGTDSWAANPWVWVVEFKRIETGAQLTRVAGSESATTHNQQSVT